MDTFEEQAELYVKDVLGTEALTQFQIHLGNGQQRAGQAFMNTLFKYAPLDYARLHGEAIDPFYRDANVPWAIGFLTRKD